MYSQPFGIHPDAGEKARTGRAPAGLLRGRADGLCVVLELAALGVTWEVVALTLVPVKAGDVKTGDRVKTDWRDALKLARGYRAGDLTPVWVPEADPEALRFTNNRDGCWRATSRARSLNTSSRRRVAAACWRPSISLIDVTLLGAWDGQKGFNGEASRRPRESDDRFHGDGARCDA